MQFYIKDDDDKFVDGTDKLDEIVRNRLAKYKQAEENKIRPELETKLRTELTPTLTNEITDKVKNEFQAKIDGFEQEKTRLEATIRQKTIAAEYGFKSDMESFLGDGSEDEMRAKADILKDNGMQGESKSLEKKTASKNDDSFITLKTD